MPLAQPLLFSTSSLVCETPNDEREKNSRYRFRSDLSLSRTFFPHPVVFTAPLSCKAIFPHAPNITLDSLCMALNRESGLRGERSAKN